MAEPHPYLRAWRNNSTPYERRCIVVHFRRALEADKRMTPATRKAAQRVLGYKGRGSNLPPNTLTAAQWRRVIGIYDTQVACHCSSAAETAARRLLGLVAGFEEEDPSADGSQLTAAQLEEQIGIRARAFVKAMDEHHTLKWRGSIRVEARDPRCEAPGPAAALVALLDAVDAAEGLNREEE